MGVLVKEFLYLVFVQSMFLAGFCHSIGSRHDYKQQLSTHY